jgi:hypothetical protein
VDPKKETNRFEELWAVFPRKHQRSKARAAYDMLAPNQVLHTQLLERAMAWAEHYETTGADKKWWKHLHTWLAQECYLEDLPEPYENLKDAAIARARESGLRKAASKTPKAGKPVGLSAKTPIGRHKVTVIGSEMPDHPNNPEQKLRFTYRIEDGEHIGKEFTHTFQYLSEDPNVQAEGESIFADLRKATRKIDPSDTSDLHDLSLMAIVTTMGKVQYEAL